MSEHVSRARASDRQDARDEAVLCWLSDPELAEIATSAYWNDETSEMAKAFDISDGNIEKLSRYLAETTTLHEEYESVVELTHQVGCQIEGVGLDVAAGVCWTTAFLSQIPDVRRLYALDISRHRLLKLAPLVLRSLGAKNAEIIRALGSFYQVGLPDNSVDFCMMSQAFHHADDPRRLLRETRRVLKAGSPALLIGEVPVQDIDLLKRRLRNVVQLFLPRGLFENLAVPHLWPSFADLYPPSLEGDHYYRPDDYMRIFRESGFSLYRRDAGNFTVFVAVCEK